MIFRPFAVALTFLTRAPIAVREVREVELGQSLAWFPAVGLLLGAVLAATTELGRGHLSPPLLALALVTLLAMVTGGLHLDGLADVVDGLSGGRGNRERTLEIMRDSRIGSHGAAAIAIALLAKTIVLVDVQQAGMTWALVLFPVAARWVACALVISFPYARKEGLGRAFNGNARSSYLVVATIMTAVLVAFVGTRAVAPTLAALFAGLTLAFWMQRRLGGLTGDCYGAAIELAEIAFLVVATSN
jgi:adenosylcobinamide-GDP ribazoletransferase